MKSQNTLDALHDLVDNNVQVFVQGGGRRRQHRGDLVLQEEGLALDIFPQNAVDGVNIPVAGAVTLLPVPERDGNHHVMDVGMDRLQETAGHRLLHEPRLPLLPVPGRLRLTAVQQQRQKKLRHIRAGPPALGKFGENTVQLLLYLS